MPAVTSLVLIGAGLGAAAYIRSVDKRKRSAIMHAVAEARRGTIDTGGWFGNPLVTLRHGDGVVVTVSSLSVRNGRYTELNATLPVPGVPTFSLSRTGFVDTVARAFGSADIVVGFSGFDGPFKLRGDDPAVVRRVWLDPRTRTLAIQFPPAVIESSGTRLMMLQPVVSSTEQLNAAIDLLLGIARSDPYGHEALGLLPEAALARDADGFYEATLPGPSPVRVGPRLHDGRMRTCVRTEAAGAVSADAATLVTPLGATLESTERELAICWPTIETDMRRLTAAIDLVRQLARGPSLGVFR